MTGSAVDGDRSPGRVYEMQRLQEEPERNDRAHERKNQDSRERSRVGHEFCDRARPPSRTSQKMLAAPSPYASSVQGE